MDCVIWQRTHANEEPVRLKFDDYMTILPMIARPAFRHAVWRHLAARIGLLCFSNDQIAHSHLVITILPMI